MTFYGMSQQVTPKEVVALLEHTLNARELSFNNALAQDLRL